MDLGDMQSCDTSKLERLQTLLFSTEKEADNLRRSQAITTRLLGFLEVCLLLIPFPFILEQ